MRVYCMSTHNNIIYVRITIHVPHPTQDRMFFFLGFEGMCLEAPQEVLFHATATHCHHVVETSRMRHICSGMSGTGLLQIQTSNQPQ